MDTSAVSTVDAAAVSSALGSDTSTGASTVDTAAVSSALGFETVIAASTVDAAAVSSALVRRAAVEPASDAELGVAAAGAAVAAVALAAAEPAVPFKSAAGHAVLFANATQASFAAKSCSEATLPLCKSLVFSAVVQTDNTAAVTDSGAVLGSDVPTTIAHCANACTGACC